MGDFFGKLTDLINATHISEQISQVDAGGLFTNWFFMVPFICLLAYLLYKQAFTNIFLIAIGFGVWFFTGTQYMQELTVNGEIQMEKVLPVAFGATVVLGVVIYLLFGRSD
jgi:glycopeptide antibiotics resistance protein